MPETDRTRRARRQGSLEVQREAVQDGDAILTSREARQLLKIGKTKLHELTCRLVIPAYRIGAGRTSGLRYSRKDLLEWLYRQKVGG